MKSGIYKIACIITNDFYIGSAVNLNKRFSQHKTDLQRQSHINKILQRVYNKYGLDNLTFDIIEQVANKELLIEREQYYMDLLKPKYNIRKKADSNLGLKYSKKTRVKMSIAKKNMSKETKLKMSQARKGKKYRLGTVTSEATKLKISKSMKGKKLSEETKLKISIANKGKKRSEETKRKISENNSRYLTGRKLSEETKNKMSESKKGNTNMLGKIHSMTSKLKMSESHKGSKNPMFGKTHSNETKLKMSKVKKSKKYDKID